MTEEQARGETVSLLQDLGLKEYEARCFLALTQASTATAREISAHSEVPRTRVYDAIRVLEAEGLVEVQHSSPQQFRAVSVDEATATLRRKYDDRLDTLESYLESVKREGEADELDQVQEVWSLAGHDGIASRTLDLVEAADEEVLLLAVDEDILTHELLASLTDAIGRGVNVIVGGISGAIVDSIQTELPEADVFETELDWLVGSDSGLDDEVAIGRLLLVDRESLLVSSFYPDEGAGDHTEQAVFATGLGNGVVVLIRRLIATGLLQIEDSGA